MAQPVPIRQTHCSAGIFGSAPSQNGEIQALVDFPDVVVPTQSPQRVSRPVHHRCINSATYVTAPAIMDSRSLPTREMVINAEGQPVWRICGMGLCLETGSGATAQAEFDALCRSAGIEPPPQTFDAPRRGPSEVDEPGV